MGAQPDVGRYPLIQSGDRFRVTREQEVPVGIRYLAPAHSMGADATLPAETVIVAMNQSPRAEPAAFWGYPEAYDELEQLLVPPEMRENERYVDYYIHFRVADVGDWLEPLDPMLPRPPDLLPRSRHRRA